MAEWSTAFASAIVIAMLTVDATFHVAKAEVVCPSELRTAAQVAIVGVPNGSRHLAEVTLYERESSEAAWRTFGPKMSAVVGRNGLGQPPSAFALADVGTPLKIEGDGRTPAGIFKLGNSFGFGTSAIAGFVSLRPGREFCVSDPESPDYNRILSKKPSGAVAGEDMGAIGLYQRGLFINYPTNAAARAGSCIFVHVWRSPRSGTSGCVALSRQNVETIQGWAKPNEAIIAILPSSHAQRLANCLTTSGTPATATGQSQSVR